jgi:hypothetical protein
MSLDPTFEELNAMRSSLLRELDAKRASFTNAFGTFLKNWYPLAAEEAVRCAPDQAVAAAKSGQLNGLKQDIRTLVAESSAIAHRTTGDPALWWHANPDAPAGGVHDALRRALGMLDDALQRAGLLDDVRRDDRGRTTHAGEAIVWSDEMIARWDEYIELLRRTGDCVDEIEARRRQQLEGEALALWRAC